MHKRSGSSTGGSDSLMRGQSRTASLLGAEIKMTVTRISTLYNHTEQKSNPEHAPCHTLRQRSYNSRKPHGVSLRSAEKRRIGGYTDRRLTKTKQMKNEKTLPGGLTWDNCDHVVIKQSVGLVKHNADECSQNR